MGGKTKLSRRDLFKLGAGAGLLTATGAWQSLRADTQEMIRVTIPSSGEKLPAVGIGTRDYRSSTDPAEMQRFRQTLEAFHATGGTVIDTSPNYGNAESVIGGLLKEIRIRDDMFMATKVDREDPQAGRQRMQQSFESLGGEMIDLMQVHNLRGTEAELETMKAWKTEGRFRYIGVTTHSPRQYAEMEGIMRKHALDFIQVNYSLADRGAEQRILPLAHDRGMAVLINLPFARGRLFGAVAGHSLPDWAAEIGASSWGQVFLKYIISAPGQILPIPGTTTPHHVIDNMGAGMGRLPGAELRREIEDFIQALL